MVSFPNAKINLGLHILRKRPDGYHEIETIFYPLPLRDALEIVENRGAGPRFSLPFSSTGLPLDGQSSNNLCMKAYRLLKKDFPRMPLVKMHLHKAIPAGGGLGGGSSDGAMTLRMLNEMFDLGLDGTQLLAYAAQLGSDCPFFIHNRPCFARGRGELLEPIDLDLSGYRFLVVNPGIHISTGRAFLDIRPEMPDRPLMELVKEPVERWRDLICNDFEKTVFPQYGEIVEVKDELYRQGAIYASMTGSGSTVYGFFKKDAEPSLSFPSSYFVKLLD